MASETIAHIVAEKRNRADEIERDVAEKMKRGEMISDQYAREVVADLRKEADRLEAARKRELAKVEAEALSAGGLVEAMRHKPGNAAAMREALLLCYRVIHCAMVAGVINRDDANKAMDAYHAALAAPPRNCDVGNEKEQAQRIDAFCKSHGTDRNGYYRCEECPLLKIDRCELKWAQMPYEAEEGGAK